MDYMITCTSTCDLTKQLLQEKDIKYTYFKFMINGRDYEDNFFEDYDYHAFYQDIKNGLEPSTSQVGFGAYMEFFEELLKEGKNIIHICLSSGISGDCMTAKSVAEELNETHENKIYVVDSLGASSGYGMLVLKAKDNLDNGMSYDDNINWIENNKLKIQHLFISTDLSSYVRGGRISGVAGLIGTALKICPLMHMPKDGTLQILDKIRTKSRAMNAMIDKMQELIDDNYNDYCYISCSNCDDDALEVARLIKERFNTIKEVKIFHVGTTIGSHTGPGTIALYFLGKQRD